MIEDKADTMIQKIALFNKEINQKNKTKEQTKMEWHAVISIIRT